MANHIEWDNLDKTVILQTYIPPYLVDDMYIMAEKSAEMINSVEHRVHIIIDESSVNRTFSSKEMKFLEKTVPHNQGTVVLVINESDFMYRNLLQTLGKAIAPHAFGKPLFFKSIEEARQYLVDTVNVQYPEAD